MGGAGPSGDHHLQPHPGRRQWQACAGQARQLRQHRLHARRAGHHPAVPERRGCTGSRAAPDRTLPEPAQRGRADDHERDGAGDPGREPQLHRRLPQPLQPPEHERAGTPHRSAAGRDGVHQRTTCDPWQGPLLDQEPSGSQEHDRNCGRGSPGGRGRQVLTSGTQCQRILLWANSL